MNHGLVTIFMGIILCSSMNVLNVAVAPNWQSSHSLPPSTSSIPHSTSPTKQANLTIF